MAGLLRDTPAFPYQFDPALRRRARTYERGSLRLSLFSGTVVPLALALGLLVTGASRYFADATAAVAPTSPGTNDALYLVGLSLVVSAATLPLAFYGRHIRESRYAMTRRSLRAFFGDAAKSAVVATLMGLALLIPLYWLMRHVDLWWAVAAALYGAFLAFSSFIMPNLILPLFYRVEPLPEGELKRTVLDAVKALGAPPISSIAVLRESAKSPRANAFIHGMGPSRRIVLFDTLLANFHPREVRFIVAHEAAHLAHRDVPRSLLIGLSLVPVKLYALSLAMPALAPAFGLRGPTDTASIPLLLLLAGLFELVERIALSPLARRAEARADAAALQATGDGEAAESMMKRLCDRNLIDDAPHPWLEALLASHPAPHRRILAARAYSTAQASSTAGARSGAFTTAPTIRASSENP